jgi:transposase
LVPHQKKAKRQGATIAFIDETGFRLQPVNRRTWSLTGVTPVQRSWDRYDRLSVVGAVTLSPSRGQICAPFQVHAANISTDQVVGFIKEQRQRVRRPLILCLDRWSVHRSAARRIEALAVPGVQFEWLPAYAPELNPVEARWSHAKHAELANFIPDDVDHLQQRVKTSLMKQRQSHQLKQSFFKTAKLKL